MASRVGTCAHPSLVAAQILRVREAWPDIWARTGRVQMASSFLASLLTGQMAGMGEAEASATGLWVHSGNQAGVQSHWDEGVMEIVGGNREEGRRIWAWLGDVDVSGGRRRIGNISRYLVERYGFDPGSLSLDVGGGVPMECADLNLAGICRDDHYSFHFRLPFIVPVAVSVTVGCSAGVRPNGFPDGTCTQLCSYTSIQPLPTPGSGC